MEEEKRICAATFAFVIVGALNWGMIGFFGIDLVAEVFGICSQITRVIYMLVGIGGLYLACKSKALCSWMR